MRGSRKLSQDINDVQPLGNAYLSNRRPKVENLVSSVRLCGPHDGICSFEEEAAIAYLSLRLTTDRTCGLKHDTDHLRSGFHINEGGSLRHSRLRDEEL